MDDKKKIIVVGALGAVIVCVGAFKFLGGSNAPAPPVVAEPTKKSPAKSLVASTAPELKNPLVANNLPARNPFEVPADQVPAKPKPLGTIQAGSKVPGTRASHGLGNLKGFQPLPPMGGDLSKISTLPSANSGARTASAAEDKPFDYKVVGTIGGVRPAVLVEDSAGNQKLVPVGSAVDGDSRVRSVEDGAVTIDHRGKKLRLTVGGNPGGK